LSDSFINSQNLDNTISEKTEVVYGIDKIITRAIERWRSTEKKMDSCIDKLQPKLLITDNMIFPELLELIKKDIRTRTIFEITEENVFYVKELMRLIKSCSNKHIIRHLDNIVGNFSISDDNIFQSHVMGDLSEPGKNNNDYETKMEQKEYNSSITYIPQCILSNVKAFVEQQQSIFELMWEKAISADQRIREIEQGIKPEVIETIKDKEEIQNLLFGLLESANEEIHIIFSTANEFHRQKNAGYFTIIKRVQETRPWIKIHILTPKDDEIQEIKNKEFPYLDIVFTEPLQRVSVLVVDKKYSLTVELKDDTKLPSADAMGLACYSNSSPTVLSYISVFETLRKQTKLLEHLKDHDKIQQEFINIAAHELKNPIQPIIGLSNILMSRQDRDQGEKDIIDTINRNAKRLKRLTEDVLDITRIDGNSLVLYKEKFNLSDTVLDIIKNYKIYDNKVKNIQFKYANLNNPIILDADRNRIHQVITNLISNCVKFIDKEGYIYIGINKIKKSKSENKEEELVIFDIKDNGIGIDKEIIPKLFTKFASKSFQGTGLGLYICKSIIEAHGGKIWAQNNKDEKGATFSFSLPLPHR
jgi:two-component system, OmpR family, sensor histidine kinase VicK